MRLILILVFLSPLAAFAASFDEVWSIVSTPTTDNKVYTTDLPWREVGLDELLRSPGDVYEASKRSLSDESDLFPSNTLKLIRPNGVCLAGTWEITKETGYTGAFAKGNRSLFIARASVNYSGAEAGEYRSFGMAGKVFPTLNTKEDVKTANFFVIDDNGGTKEEHFLNAPLLSEAKLSKFNIVKAAIVNFSWELIRKLKLAEKAQNEADSEPKVRQLYPFSQVGLKDIHLAKTPALIKLQGVADLPRVKEKDFRRELRVAHYGGKLRFGIYLAQVREAEPKWTTEPVGFVEFTQDAVSDACDMRLRFHHPWWKNSTETLAVK